MTKFVIPELMKKCDYIKEQITKLKEDVPNESLIFYKEEYYEFVKNLDIK